MVDGEEAIVMNTLIQNRKADNASDWRNKKVIEEEHLIEEVY